MSVTIVAGSVFDSDAQTKVCTVNVVGVMGAGVALEFKKRYPTMFEAYKRACRDYHFREHRNFRYRISDQEQVLCMMTKGHWKNPSKPEWIEAAFKEIAKYHREMDITSLAMPPPGCGNGGLLWWEEVYPLVMQYLDPLPIPVSVHIPSHWMR